MRFFVLLVILAATASFTTSMQQLLRATPSPQRLMQPAASRSAVATIRLAEDGGDAEQEASAADDAAPPNDAAPVDESSADKAKADDEEEDDLLSSPAFLKQKLKVLEKEMEEVAAKKVEAQAEAEAVGEEWADKRARLQGDFDNFRARHVNQTLEAQVEARIKLLKDFLPVLDNFDRARESITLEGDAQNAVDAKYQEMHANLMSTLTDELGMRKIETVGAEFDYNVHLAIQSIPNDEYDEGVVCSEMQTGFMINEQLVRAAYVMVSSG